MGSRFEQSTPPSLDKLYRDVPIGPFSVPPLLNPVRTGRPVRNSTAVVTGQHWFLRLNSMLRRLSTGSELPLTRRLNPGFPATFKIW